MLDGRDRFHFEDIWLQKAGEDGQTRDYRPGENARVDAAVRILQPGERLLDVGCGSGLLATLANPIFREIYGVDISSTAVEIARKHGVNAKVHNLNDTPLPWANDFFDVVTALAVLQYVYDLDFVLAELVRVLKPGGRLFACVPNMRALWRLWRLTIRGTFPRTSLDSIGNDGGTIHYFCTRNLEDLIQQHGMTMERSFGIFCLPGFVNQFSDFGLPGKVKREFFSAEVFVVATKLKNGKRFDNNYGV